MNAKKCDRCGRFYETNKSTYHGNVIKGICLRVSKSSDDYDYCYIGDKDLCDKCINLLDKWISHHAEILERIKQE